MNLWLGPLIQYLGWVRVENAKKDKRSSKGHILVEKVLDERGDPRVVPLAVDEQNFREEAEPGESKIRAAGCLPTFFPHNTYEGYKRLEWSSSSTCWFDIPSPMWASWIMEMSLAPSPMAAVVGFPGKLLTSFTTYKKNNIINGQVVRKEDDEEEPQLSGSVTSGNRQRLGNS